MYLILPPSGFDAVIVFSFRRRIASQLLLLLLLLHIPIDRLHTIGQYYQVKQLIEN
jgi:hypothetical protein